MVNSLSVADRLSVRPACQKSRGKPAEGEVLARFYLVAKQTEMERSSRQLIRPSKTRIRSSGRA
eukprot:3245415-Pyramimonas_sp.AAC.1